MYRFLKPLATIALIAVSVALYRTWVERNKLPLFIPLGFFENALQVKTPEERARDPENWKDPIATIVRDDETFRSLARNAGAEERTVDVLVTGATFGGLSAAITAAENGVSVALLSETDWKSELLSNAMPYLADGTTMEVPFSDIERRVRKWKSNAAPALELEKDRVIFPTDIAEFFEKTMASRPALRIFETHFIAAFGKDRSGKIDRALVQAADGSNASVLRFSYMIDGTSDGSAMALAGAETNAGWDDFETTGEPNTMTAETATAMAEGYTMSGRTIVGIGRRNDAALMNLAVIDRGYHGIFAHPTIMSDCWKRDTKTLTPFIIQGAVYKAQNVGCEATTVMQPTFGDTAEVFFINHGAESVTATIAVGSGTAFNVVAKGNANDEFIRIGAFPVSQTVPLSITVRSSSPTDRFEGFIMRKMNVNAAPVAIKNSGGESATFLSAEWRETAYDAYVFSKASTPPRLQIDNATYRTEPIGTDTFMARDVVLSTGKHALYRTSGSEYTILIPKRPHRETIPLARQKSSPEATTWSFIARKNSTVGVLAPSSMCGTSCKITLTAHGTTTAILKETLRNRSSAIHSDIPMGTAAINEGTTYVIKAEGVHDPSKPPIVTLLDESAELYAIGTKNVAIVPPPGGMYDVWIRSLRNDKSVATIGKRNYAIDVMGEWQKIATEPLSSDGITFSGGGAMEIMAIPNVSIDAYAVNLEKKGVPVNLRDIPSGNYSLKSFGTQNPSIINATTENTDVVPIAFIDDGSSYVSRKEHVIDGGGSALSLTTPWAQRVYLYESIRSRFFIAHDDQALLMPILGTADLMRYDAGKGMADMGRTSSGIFLFDPYPLGIGPVTIGDLGTEEHQYYVRDMLNDAYMILRTGNMGVAKSILAGCTDSTPTCDPRRLERAQGVYGTTDALPPFPHYPDTRRLVGLETLSYADAYTAEPACAACTTNAPTNAILSFRPKVYPTTIVSPAEQRLATLPTLISSLRRDKKMSTNGTYLEYGNPERDVSLTLGMFLSANEPNVLSGNSTLSATHIASRTTRSPRVQMAIGSVTGLSTAFAVKKELSDLRFIARSPDATARLQNYLVHHGITVMPLFEPGDDPLLLQALQQRILDAKTSLRSIWINNRLSFMPVQNENSDPSLLQLMLFGNEPVMNMRDALKSLPDSPQNATDIELLAFGLRTQIIVPKMFQFSLDEIMRIPLDEELLLKIEYLMRSPE